MALTPKYSIFRIGFHKETIFDDALKTKYLFMRLNSPSYLAFLEGLHN